MSFFNESGVLVIIPALNGWFPTVGASIEAPRNLTVWDLKQFAKQVETSSLASMSLLARTFDADKSLQSCLDKKVIDDAIDKLDENFIRNLFGNRFIYILYALASLSHDICHKADGVQNRWTSRELIMSEFYSFIEDKKVEEKLAEQKIKAESDARALIEAEEKAQTIFKQEEQMKAEYIQRTSCMVVPNPQITDMLARISALEARFIKADAPASPSSTIVSPAATISTTTVDLTKAGPYVMIDKEDQVWRFENGNLAIRRVCGSVSRFKYVRSTNGIDEFRSTEIAKISACYIRVESPHALSSYWTASVFSEIDYSCDYVIDGTHFLRMKK